MPLHFIRSFDLYSSRPTILILGNHPAFPYLFHQQIFQHHYAWREQSQAWEIDGEAEGMVWWIVADLIGLAEVCIHCLSGQCVEARAILSFQKLQFSLREHMRAFAAKASAGYQEPVVLSSETDIRRYRPSGSRLRDLPTPEQAAEILQIEWPTTKAIVLRAFKRKTLEAHPDRKMGGSDAQMRKVLSAREALLELL